MKPWQNSEGYNDPTAYGAIKSENAREAELARLIKTLKYVIGLSEFEDGHMEFQDPVNITFDDTKELMSAMGMEAHNG